MRFVVLDTSSLRNIEKFQQTTNVSFTQCAGRYAFIFYKISQGAFFDATALKSARPQLNEFRQLKNFKGQAPRQPPEALSKWSHQSPGVRLRQDNWLLAHRQ